MQKLFIQESIAVLIARTRRSIKQFAWEKLRPWRVTPQQCGVLLVLFSEGGMSLGEVAGRIWCDNPTACRIVNKLVERGFVRSDSDAQDRRRFRLYLTPDGQALCGELTQCANTVAQTLEQGLPEEDILALRRILSQVMNNAIGGTQRTGKAPRGTPPACSSATTDEVSADAAHAQATVSSPSHSESTATSSEKLAAASPDMPATPARPTVG